MAAARAERAHGHRGVNHAAVQAEFQFLRGRSHAQGAANQVLDVAGGVAADQSRARSSASRERSPKIWRAAVLMRRMLALGIERKNAGGNIFETVSIRSRRRSSSCTACCRLLRELVDLLAAVGELRGHVVERAHQRAQFVLRLDLHLGIEMAGGDFAGGFGQGLDRHGDFLGQVERKPGGAKKKQDGEQREGQKDLPS